MIFIHDAIWGRELWPQGIFVNGSILMEGAKMSKSMNNIIPLVNAIDRFGADPLRISLMITAEPLKDADFSPELAKSMVGLLEGFHARAQRIISEKQEGAYELQEIDLWMLSRLQSHISDANEAMHELKVRKTIHAATYDLDGDLDWYLKRVAFDREHQERKRAISHVEWTVLDAQVRMLAPFTPHMCEEIWEQMGNEGFVAFAPWPEVDGALIREDAEELETIIKTCTEDVANITKVTGIKPTTIHFYTADNWKWKMLEKAMEMQTKGNIDIGTMIREAFKDEEMRTKQKEVPAYARTLVDDVKKMPERTLKLRREMGHVNETTLIQDAESFLRAEFGCDVTVSGESDPWIEDPAKRASRAKPYRPAIYVA
jgi:leucyl-tRNA synthetase